MVTPRRPGLAEERAAFAPPPPSAGGARPLVLDAVRWWWLPLLVTAAAVLLAWTLAARERKVWQATASLAVIPAPSITDEGDVARALETLERRTLVATFSRIAETRETKVAAGREVGVDDAALRGYALDAQVVPSTNVIRVRVEGSDPARAAALANAAAGITATDAARLYRLFALQMVEAAVAPSRPVRPDVGRSVGVALFLGLVVGTGLAFAAAFARRALVRPV
jgi:hypothetical protein